MKLPALPARPLVLSILALAASAAWCRSSAAADPTPDAGPQARSVILLIADGCGVEAYTLARSTRTCWCSTGAPPNWKAWLVYASNTKRVYVPMQAVQIIAGTAEPLPAVAR